jgi:hypothetical protein
VFEVLQLDCFYKLLPQHCQLSDQAWVSHGDEEPRQRDGHVYKSAITNVVVIGRPPESLFATGSHLSDLGRSRRHFVHAASTRDVYFELAARLRVKIPHHCSL